MIFDINGIPNSRNKVQNNHNVKTIAKQLTEVFRTICILHASRKKPYGARISARDQLRQLIH